MRSALSLQGYDRGALVLHRARATESPSLGTCRWFRSSKKKSPSSRQARALSRSEQSRWQAKSTGVKLGQRALIQAPIAGFGSCWRGMGTNLPFLFTSYFSKPMTMQWLMGARRIGKRLASLEPPAMSRLSDETHEVICGVAGCVVKRKKLRRITE